MSAHAYVPRINGVHYEGIALPGRNPLDGQFVSTKPGPYAVDHDDELLGDCSSLELRLAYFDSGDEPKEEDDNPLIMFAYPDPRPFDKYDELAKRCNQHELWHDELSAEAWVRMRYNLYYHLSEDYFNEVVGEQFEHLPHRHGRIASFRSHPEYAGYWSPDECRGFYQSHGKHGRLGGYKLRKHRDIRQARQNTNRQIEYLWLVEMTADYEAYGRMTAEAFLDGFLDFDEIKEGLRWLAERDNDLNDKRWRGYHTGPMTEAGQNCHGFGDRDPFEEDLFPEPEYRFDPFTGQFRYFYGDKGMDDSYDWYDYHADKWEVYDDPVDQYEFNILSDEYMELLDAEAAAEEAEAEVLEFAFEHLPCGNGRGHRAQLAAAAARI